MEKKRITENSSQGFDVLILYVGQIAILSKT